MPCESILACLFALPQLKHTLTRNLRILVVDDDPTVLDFVCTVFSHQGAEAIAFSSSPEAAACIESESFDAVVTDLDMPLLGGLELVRRVRASILNFQTYVAILTGTTGSADAKAGLRAGADLLLQKPVTLEGLQKLLAEIRVQLSGQKKGRERSD